MNLTLKVTKKEGANMCSLLKLMCSLKCPMSVDSEAGNISIINMDDEKYDDVIDAINAVFNIDHIYMNSANELPKKGEQPLKILTQVKRDNTLKEHKDSMEEVSGADEIISEDASDDSTKESKGKNAKMTAESYLTSIIADALDALNKSEPLESQIDDFLDAVGLDKSEILLREALIASCNVQKVGYESILIKLHNEFPKLNEDKIKATLTSEFKKWLSKHPEVKEKYPKMSIMTLLKVVAKKMA